MSSPYSAPGQTPPAPPSSLNQTLATPSISSISRVLASGAGWMKFVGIMVIIPGVLYCLTIIGAIIGWLPIWVGILIMQAADAIERAERGNDVVALEMALEKIRKLFTITGVMMLIYLGLIILAMLLFGAAIIAGIRNGGFPHH